jgi:hypothetical protein
MIYATIKTTIIPTIPNAANPKLTIIIIYNY